MALYEQMLRDLGEEEEIEDTAVCFRCGKEVKIPYHRPRDRFFCDECAEVEDLEYQQTLETYIESKKKVTFENAIRMLEKTKRYELATIRDEVFEIQENYFSGEYEFLSAYEIISAIVLKINKIEYEVNKRIGKRYKIDFFIPSKHICLEVDGELHEHKLVADGKRDVEIRQILGGEWETIRIPTRYLKRYPDRLPLYMDEMYKKTKDAREKHNGILPRDFSQSVKAYYDSVFTDEYVTYARKV